MREGLHLVPRIYQLHPISVHFPIVLLTLGLAAFVFLKVFKRPAWLEEAVSWCLWLGTAGAWVAVLLGLVAADKAPHVPAAWETLADHKVRGIATGVAFTFLSLWRLFSRGRKDWLFMILWFWAFGLLVYTGLYGGALVYDFGMGVVR